MPDVQHKRGTRAALDALASADGLLPAQIYLIEDEDRIAIATSSGSYETYAKQSEAGGAGGPSAKGFVLAQRDNTAPTSTMGTSFTNLSLPITVSDPDSLWDGTFYTVQATGLHVIDATLRVPDNLAAGRTVGFGIHTSTGDFVGFGWFGTSGAKRNVFFYKRVGFFTAGQLLRFFHYSDSSGVNVDNAALSIYRLTI